MNTNNSGEDNIIDLGRDFELIEGQYISDLFLSLDLEDINEENYRRNEIIFELIKVNNLGRKERIKQQIEEESKKSKELFQTHLNNYTGVDKVRRMLKINDKDAESELKKLQENVQKIKQEEKEDINEIKSKVHETSNLLKEKMEVMKNVINQSFTKEEINEILDSSGIKESAKKNIEDILFEQYILRKANSLIFF